MKLFNTEVRTGDGRYSSVISWCREASEVLFYSYLWFVLGALTLSLGFGYMPEGYEPPVTSFVEVVQAEEIEVDPTAPILERIAKCESGGNHFGKSGQVLLSPNTNHTVDVGRYQINTVWFGKATELGLDITTEEGNYQMALWIFENRGTEDWYSSKHCWSK